MESALFQNKLLHEDQIKLRAEAGQSSERDLGVIVQGATDLLCPTRDLACACALWPAFRKFVSFEGDGHRCNDPGIQGCVIGRRFSDLASGFKDKGSFHKNAAGAGKGMLADLDWISMHRTGKPSQSMVWTAKYARARRYRRRPRTRRYVAHQGSPKYLCL